jgi:hypothetical protein
VECLPVLVNSHKLLLLVLHGVAPMLLSGAR